MKRSIGFVLPFVLAGCVSQNAVRPMPEAGKYLQVADPVSGEVVAEFTASSIDDCTAYLAQMQGYRRAEVFQCNNVSASDYLSYNVLMRNSELDVGFSVKAVSKEVCQVFSDYLAGVDGNSIVRVCMKK